MLNDNNIPSERHFQAYLEFASLGLRAQAKTAVKALIRSLPSQNEKETWVLKHFDELRALVRVRGRIQHDIYLQIVFPAIRASFEKGDPEAMFMLAITWENVAETPDAKDIATALGPIELLKRASACEPENKLFKQTLLEELVSSFEYIDHEWPAGLLLDHSNLQGELLELKNELKLARNLDHEKRYTKRLNEFSSNVDAYWERINSKETGH
ncbi:hypothetical protein Q4544_09905 [Cognatishimia sp. 1_MG-2023]|uniref:hypothetical protein n=1 Tax=Cognatishimia sp. 1_MG-2023 TaxID=3062642 RepID=UPI0026E335F9|nr:hypothetical protein [Cognatishimia sp. 1_MG-2023]MDO6727246.1 hypothetical protein [Cognatishimia sp. 1_MG-2023]